MDSNVKNSQSYMANNATLIQHQRQSSKLEKDAGGTHSNYSLTPRREMELNSSQLMTINETAGKRA